MGSLSGDRRSEFRADAAVSPTPTRQEREVRGQSHHLINAPDTHTHTHTYTTALALLPDDSLYNGLRLQGCRQSNGQGGVRGNERGKNGEAHSYKRPTAPIRQYGNLAHLCASAVEHLHSDIAKACRTAFGKRESRVISWVSLFHI
jgi:hypothetical protein